jgi:hypothetical protein
MGAWDLKHIYTVLCVGVGVRMCGCGRGRSSGDEALELELFGSDDAPTIASLEERIALLLRSQSEGAKAIRKAVAALREAEDIGRLDLPDDDKLTDVLEQVGSAINWLDPDGDLVVDDNMSDSS